MVQKVEKPWGHEIRWAVNEKYLGKILFIKSGQRLSKQYHEVKDETIYVLEGSLLLEYGPNIEAYSSSPDPIREVLHAGTARRIRPGTIHRFCAELGDVSLLEVSTPEINDVVRMEDDYDREKETDIESLYIVYGGD
ncbi:MAG TPA: cupin [Flavobacteriales bacterium]|jgi:mannose-6-phosphate isomerase-like protein (cupin superfamily)|nr:cupin [Flavobacteriales bacterium]